MDIVQTYTEFLAYTKSNPVVAGVVSLWGLTVLTFFLKEIPLKIKNFVRTQCITSLELDNGGYTNRHVYQTCMEWIFSKKKLSFSRNFSIHAGDYIGSAFDSVSIGPGFGNHFFFYKKRIMILTITALDSQGSDHQKRQLFIKTIGRNRKVLEEFLKDFTPEPINKNVQNELFTFDPINKIWDKECNLQTRSLNSIAMSEKTKNFFINQITHFNNNEKWFTDKGIAYKLTYILHGIPGTGKTSLIKAIAGHFKKDICLLSINQMSDVSLQSSLSRIRENSVVVIEDFDSVSASKSREKVDTLNNENTEEFSFLSLTGLLNNLDGIRSLHNVIIFLTTNHLEKIDPALYRKGRVDEIVEIKEATADDVLVYSQFIFPDYDFSKVKFKDTLGCNLNDALLQSRGDTEKYIEMLTK